VRTGSCWSKTVDLKRGSAEICRCVYDLSPDEIYTNYPNGSLAFFIEPEANKFSLFCRV
jgi:hypothetical protein